MNPGRFAASDAELDRRTPRTPVLEFFRTAGASNALRFVVTERPRAAVPASW